MSLFGSLFKTGFDLATLPIALVKDAIPGAGGYVDGERSHTGRKIDQLRDDGSDIRDDLSDL